METGSTYQRTYLAIDLKSFYASVECTQLGLDPLTTNLVVADKSRTEKTICLAVSPSLKAYGISGRARLFEVVQQVAKVNAQRRRNASHGRFTGKSSDDAELKEHPEFELDYLVARPRMALYMQKSTEIYKIYLRHVAPEDIHVYSIDEVFIDVTGYLRSSGKTPAEFAMMLIREVLQETGITATAGIGTNLYLAKVAMDIVAKHAPADENGVRMAELDEMSYRKLLWDHRPLTDFWRVGRGYARRLDQMGLGTMGDIARCSLGGSLDRKNEDLLYEAFGINAELLIDHAWGWEPCTMADIKAYRPQSNSLGTGQVLHEPYDYAKTRLVVHEMAEQLSLDLVAKRLVTNQIVLTIGYDISNVSQAVADDDFDGKVVSDWYGRRVPKHAHGTANLERHLSSSRRIIAASLELFDGIINPKLLSRRINITACNVIPESELEHMQEPDEQLNLLVDYEELEEKRAEEDAELAAERRRQEAILSARRRFGKNAVLKGMNLQEGATQKDRNRQIGGHRA